MPQNTQISDASFLDPERIARSFGLERGDHVADFGAGHGFFTIPMARIVGGDGKVYAIDVQKPTLEIITARGRAANLLTIETVWADLDTPKGSGLRDRFLDFVLIANILFQSEQKQTMLGEAYRILCEGGRMALIEWNQDPAPLGPPLAMRIAKDAAKRLASGTGFELDREFGAGAHHYGLLFRKP